MSSESLGSVQRSLRIPESEGLGKDIVTLAPHKKLGKYDIAGILGRGAMGTVYEGYDPSIQRRVAIKTINKDSLSPTEAAELLGRFKREAQAAGRLNHPGIVSIYEYGETDDVAFIAMEYIKGKELKNYFDTEQRFSVPDVIRIMADILDALEHAHRNGVVHRDIKPANIMITEEGRVKVADFGVARIESSVMTQVGTRIGTPAYMSPEQYQGQPVDGRSDLFSAGVILYQFLTGERPFTGGAYTILQSIYRGAVPPSNINSSTPRTFDTVVSKALAPRVEDRFKSAHAFIDALKEAAAGRSQTNELPPVADVRNLSPATAGAVPPPSTTDGVSAKKRNKSRDTAVAGVDMKYDMEFWREIKGSKNPEDYTAFISAFPNSKFVHLAHRQLTVLRLESQDQQRDLAATIIDAAPREVIAQSVESQHQPKGEAEEQARPVAELQAQRAAEAQRIAAEQRAQREAEEKARHEAELQAQRAAEAQRIAAEQRAQREAEEKARREAELQAQRAAEAQRIAAEQRAQREAEEKARREAELQAQRAAEAQRIAAEQRAQLASEEKAHREAELQALHDAEAQRIESEQHAKRVLEEQLHRETDFNAGPEAEKAVAPQTTDPESDIGHLRALEELLMTYVGPIAKLLIKKAGKTTADGNQLIRLLADSISSEQDKKAFVAEARARLPVIAAPPDHSNPERVSMSVSLQPFDPNDLAKAASQLAPYLGPIANVLVKRLAARATDRNTLYLLLADNISDVEDRKKFLTDAGYG